MSVQSDTQRVIDALEDAGADTEPEGHERMRCACGYTGTPSHVLRFGEVESSADDSSYFVCPECGDY